MSLREDFKDIGYEMARIINKEIEQIRADGKKKIAAIKEEIEQRINHDTLKMELKIIQKKQFELNKIESDKITEINQTIAERKVNTLILVNKVTLVNQWKEKLTEFLTVNEAVDFFHGLA